MTYFFKGRACLKLLSNYLQRHWAENYLKNDLSRINVTKEFREIYPLNITLIVLKYHMERIVSICTLDTVEGENKRKIKFLKTKGKKVKISLVLYRIQQIDFI